MTLHLSSLEILRLRRVFLVEIVVKMGRVADGWFGEPKPGMANKKWRNFAPTTYTTLLTKERENQANFK